MEHSWEARPVQPIVILYVLGVFVPFMLFTHLVVHSLGAVKGLFSAAIGAVASLVATTLTRSRYRLTEAGVSKGPVHAKEKKPPKILFAWDELSHVVPTRNGFKYYKRMTESNPLLRFWKLHISDQYAGMLLVEAGDRARVREIILEKGISLGRPDASGRIGSSSTD